MRICRLSADAEIFNLLAALLTDPSFAISMKEISSFENAVIIISFKKL
ncbi:hypothetical protein MED121_02690 [Marinomonas sp. MED121]|nr:hypothetical protein MED121_02690 [Marinomonas sp. MED121]